MKILIIEDEPLVAKDLITRLKKIHPGYTLIGPLTSVEASLEWFKTNPMPDLILSDIQLSDGISFDVFEKLPLSCPIIFTTAYDAYAIRAFKLNSIDYLLKPIDAGELEKAIDKYRSLSTTNIISEQLKLLTGHWDKDSRKYKERFLCVQRNALIPVECAQICFFHKEELIYIHTLSQEKLIADHQTLDEIEAMLDPQKFFRVNRQFIIHIQAVGKIKTTHKGLTVQLKSPSSQELDISREKASAFKTWIEEV